MPHSPSGDPSPLLARRGLSLLRILVALSLLFAALPAEAHPHVWASVRSEAILGPDDKLEAVRQVWTFDEFYSAMAIQGLDTDGDGKYSAAELAPLAEVNVKSLHEFDYFTFVSVGDEKIKLKEPVDYTITTSDAGIVTLRFTLPLETPLSAKAQTVKLEVYDPSFYVAFGFAEKDPLTTAGASAAQCKLALESTGSGEDAKELTEAFFSQLGPDSNFGSQYAQAALLTCSN